FLSPSSRLHRAYASFPTRRSSDLGPRGVTNVTSEVTQREYDRLRPQYPTFCGCDTCRGDVMVYALNRLSPRYVSTRAGEILTGLDRKSTRLNSSHEWISYAVFCLK